MKGSAHVKVTREQMERAAREKPGAAWARGIEAETRAVLKPNYVGIAQGVGNHQRPKTYVYFRYYDRGKKKMRHAAGLGIWFEGFTTKEVFNLVLEAGRAARVQRANARRKTTAQEQSPMLTPTIGRVVLYKNEAGVVYPAIVSAVNQIVNPPKGGVEQIVTELRLTVFDADFGPKVYTCDKYAGPDEDFPNSTWTWPISQAVPVQVPIAQLQALVDAAVHNALADATDSVDTH